MNRLRSKLGDELLVRGRRNYELTPRGSELLDELAQVMPRLVRLWAAETFSPAQSEGHIRLAMNDYASSVVLAPLAETCGRHAPGITPEAVSWHKRTHEESGLVTTHLILSPLSVPSTFRAKPLFEDVFLCVLGRKLRHRRASLAMKGKTM